MTRFAQDRSYYIPKEEKSLVEINEVNAVAYTYERNSRLYALGFAGKAQKPTFHYSFKTEQGRGLHISNFFACQKARIARKEEEQAKRRAFQHTLKVGDVLRSAWGYDQTNIDYYQVVALKGAKQVVCRRIAAVSEVTGWETGKCGPDVGNFLERYEPQTFLVQQGNSIRVASYACAYPVPCQKVGALKVYETDRWSSYA